jgi:hypothetical protein
MFIKIDSNGSDIKLIVKSQGILMIFCISDMRFAHIFISSASSGACNICMPKIRSGNTTEELDAKNKLTIFNGAVCIL